MALLIDARVPVRLAAALEPTDADTLLVVEHGLDLLPPRGRPVRLASFAPAHDALPAGVGACDCCNGRAPFATELGTLFRERARNDVPFFRQVLAVGSPRGLAHARAALLSDPFLLGRYREDRRGAPAG